MEGSKWKENKNRSAGKNITKQNDHVTMRQCIKQFSTKCLKIKTTVITLENHKRRRQSNEPIRTRSKIHVADAKRGKMYASKSRLVLFYF